MKFAFRKLIAVRYLGSRRKEVFISIISIISVLGVALSVMVLNMTLGIMTGLESKLQEKLISASAHITISSYFGEINKWREVVKSIESIDGVNSATPYTYNPAMVTSEYGSRGILVRGVFNNAKATKNIESVLEEGFKIGDLFSSQAYSFDRNGKEYQANLPSIIVGRELRNKLALMPGEPLTLLSPQMTSTPQGLSPRFKRFLVTGSYSSGLIEYESGLAYVSLESAQKFFDLGDTVTGIEINVEDLFMADEISNKIAEVLEKKSKNSFRIVSWTEANRPLWEALKLEKRVYFLVLLLLILIASFSIVSTLVMLVMEKSKDIAILKTIGASHRDILQIFLLQSVIIGGVGVLLGTVLGYLGSIGLREYGFEMDPTVFSVDKLPVYIIPQNYFVVAVVSFLITSTAGIYPAYRAARLRPADVLRYE